MIQVTLFFLFFLMISTGQDVIFHQNGVTGKVLSLKYACPTSSGFALGELTFEGPGACAAVTTDMAV